MALLELGCRPLPFAVDVVGRRFVADNLEPAHGAVYCQLTCTVASHVTELLKRAVFYKVGHHGSANATARDLFEAMTTEGLLAFVPVDARQVSKTRWKNVPSEKLMKRIHENNEGRMIRSDDPRIRNERATLPPAMVEKAGSARLVCRGGNDIVSWVELQVTDTDLGPTVGS